jgi:ABC-type lipoprotein release transport system permease subunit
MNIVTSLRIGLFLAIRYVKRASVWTTLLIIFIMLLTFLNVVVVRGILVGLPEGARISYEDQYAGSVIVTSLAEKAHIESTPYVLNVLQNTTSYEAHSLRYVEVGVAEANYKQSRPSNVLPDQVSVPVVGINIADEDRLTHLSDRVVEGEYLQEGDVQGVLVGHQLLERYAVGVPTESDTIAGVYPGDTIRITVGDSRREYIVRGVIKSKASQNARRIFLLEEEARRVMDRFDRAADEISVRVAGEVGPEKFRDKLYAAGLGEYAVIQTAAESQGQFLEDIKDTFSVLSDVIGAIGIAVATITVFIVIFIFAITRQKQIGILKGIGINRLAIESSYVFLSMFYAAIGIVLGVGLLYGFIQPYIAENPINFPFADGILIAPYGDTGMRSLYIIIATILAGYVPARMIVQKNTINAILGR